MASTMLHYVIASLIVKKVNMDNPEQFIMGALLPDASSHEDKSYDKAHFMMLCEGKKGFDWQEFKNMYYDEIQTNAIFRGYMCHIIMDAVWFHQIADKYIRIYPQTVRGKYYNKAYKDYWKLNYILPRKYGISEIQIEIPQINIAEIDQTLIAKVFEGLHEQFHISESYEPDDMDFIPYEAIEDYIQKSINLCIQELGNIQKKECYLNPKELYVPK